MGNDKLNAYGKSLMKAMGATPGAPNLEPSSAKFWGAEHPKSLVNLLEDQELVAAATAIPVSTFQLPESQLEKMCPEGRPSRQDRRLRIEFWEAYEKAASDLSPMDLQAMVQGTGIRHWEAYRSVLLEDANFLAWFLTPPASYRVQMKEALELGLSRLVEIMSLPITDAVTGKIRADVGALILQAYKLVDLRTQGSVAQKIVSLTADAGQVPDNASLSMEEIDKKLAELEAQLRGQIPAPKDVVAQFEQLPDLSKT